MKAESLNLWNNILLALQAMSWLEVLGVVSALAYVILAAKKSILCWVAAIISSMVYGVLFYQAKLYSESILQTFYLAMAIYGWINWQNNARKNQKLIITEWPIRYHLINIFISSILCLVAGFLFSKTDASYPYIDAFTTVFAISATFMVVQRVLSNWLYWIIIDAVGIALFAAKELYLTSLLFVVYVIIASVGYFKWKAAKETN